jgi:hypothetical protein
MDNNVKRSDTSEMLDRLAVALAEEISQETGRPKEDVLAEIVATGEACVALQSPRRSPQNALA